MHYYSDQWFEILSVPLIGVDTDLSIYSTPLDIVISGPGFANIFVSFGLDDKNMVMRR